MRQGREYADYLRDMLTYSERAEGLIADLDLNGFLLDEAKFLAVVRALEIIGEAARHVPANVRRRWPEVPWRRMVAMRNKLIHEYFGVDPEVIWRTVREDLPALRAALAGLEEELNQDDADG